jgi:large subunit ribosomal protein L32
MVIRMRHTRAHTANRRSHHALKSASFSKCSHCGKLRPPHTACASCGYYRDRKVIDVVKRVEKKVAKAKKAVKK